MGDKNGYEGKRRDVLVNNRIYPISGRVTRTETYRISDTGIPRIDLHFIVQGNLDTPGYPS